MQKVSIVSILILIGLLFLQRECQRCPEVETIYRVDTIPGDRVPVLVPIDKPYPQLVIVDTGSWHYHDIDTMAIVRDYFAKAIYCDTLKNDSSAFIALIDTVHMNRLQGRSLVFANRRPTAIIHTTTIEQQKERMKLYAGAWLSLSKEQEPDFGPTATLLTKKGYGYGYAYGVQHKTHQVSLLWKVKF